MGTVTFQLPNSVLYTHDSGRELEFTQAETKAPGREIGDVSVRVYYGLNEISRISQKNIYVERKKQGIQRVGIKNLASLTSSERKNVLKAIAVALDKDAILDDRSSVFLEITDGIATDIIHRQTLAPLYTARSITVVLN